MQLQQESPRRQVAGSNPGSKYEDANTNIINSQHHEIKLLKAALESAKKEKRMLEEDHAKEKAMLLESNSKVKVQKFICLFQALVYFTNYSMIKFDKILKPPPYTKFCVT